jgi:hypothetical protein
MDDSAEEVPQFHYLGDGLQSIGSEDSDPFGHLDYANTVVREMDLFPPQFTFGLFGDWGSGKSTILEEVGRQLREEQETKTAFVLFDAWRYEGDSLRREFIRSVGEGLDGQRALKEKFNLERHLEAFDSETTRVSGRGRILDLALLRSGLLAALLVGALLGALIFALGKTGISSTHSEKLLIAVAGAAATFILFPLQRVVSPDPVQTTRRRLEYPDQFARNFGALLDAVASERLVIAIDNLDRCSPARVTEVLSSVKTFLEPAFSAPLDRKVGVLRKFWRWLTHRTDARRSLERLCFIVAADDNALRRHLTAQELSRERTPGASTESELPAEVSASVEEYLRKFFGTTIRVRELLDEDVRSFTREQLVRLIAAEEIGKEDAERLIEMTSQVLKRNPRRIKQFVNNLRMRLQVLAERKRNNRVLLEVDVRVVAKVAIIEEEFPEHYRKILDEPELLGKWQNRLNSAGREEGSEAAGEDRQEELPQRLVNFLRFTDDVDLRDIRAYLKLKQTRAEMQLPRHAEFVELLDDGEVERIADLLGEESGNEDIFTEAAREHFVQERNARAWGRTHNTLRVIAQVALLQGEGGRGLEAVLRDALRIEELRERIGQLDPNALLEDAVRHDFATEITDQLIAELIRALGRTEQSEQRHSIASALAAQKKLISEDNRMRLAEVLAADHLRGDFEAYQEIAEQIAEVLGPEILDAALGRIEELGVEGLSISNAAFRVALAALRSRRDDERLDRFLGLSRPLLAQMRDAGSNEIGAVAGSLAEAVRSGGATQAMVEFAVWLSSEWGSFAGDQREGVGKLAIALCQQSPDADANAGAGLVNSLFEHGEPNLIVELLEGGPGELPDQLNTQLRALLAEALAGERHGLSEGQVDRLFDNLATDQRVGLRRDALNHAIGWDRLEIANELFRGLEEAEQEEVIEAAIQRVTEGPAQHIGDARFLGEVGSRIDEERRFALAMQLAQTIHSERSIVTQVAPVLGELELAEPEHRLDVVDQMVQSELDMSDPDNRVAMLRACWRVAGRPASKAKRLAESRLRDVRKSGEQPMAGVAAELLSGRA